MAGDVIFWAPKFNIISKIYLVQIMHKCQQYYDPAKWTNEFKPKIYLLNLFHRLFVYYHFPCKTHPFFLLPYFIISTLQMILCLMIIGSSVNWIQCNISSSSSTQWTKNDCEKLMTTSSGRWLYWKNTRIW